MCGLAGVCALRDGVPPPSLEELTAMAGALRHRGPDEFGVYRDARAGLAHARLSIIDLSTGQQPLAGEGDRTWIVFNGEIFNYLELREELVALGHRFRTRSDTEVIVHAFERWGASAFARFNGQFAVALWDRREQVLTLARDRLGVRPLYLCEHGGRLFFASEVKAIFAAHPEIPRALDPRGLDETFTFWTVVPPQSVFRGVEELEPGHVRTVHRDGRVRQERFWSPAYRTDAEGKGQEAETLDESAARVRDALERAVSLRVLRSDVPVGSYLSGGLDSSLVAALGRRATSGRFSTFSLRFEDAEYDETAFQREMARRLESDHRELVVSRRQIAEAFPAVVAAAERPMLRTAPAPLYLLSGLVREAGIKVVLTGEGADEMFAGYDLFREARVRRFWARMPGSTLRPLLLARLYPYLARSPVSQRAIAERFFGRDLARWREPGFSHALRWQSAAALKRLFAPELRGEARGLRRRRQAPLVTARGVPALDAARPGPVPGGAHAALRLPALLAGRPAADGALRGGPLPVPGRRRGRARQPAPRRPQAARAGREARPQARRPAAGPREHRAAQEAALPRPGRAGVRRSRSAELGRRGALGPRGARRRGLRRRRGRAAVGQVSAAVERRPVLQRRQHGAGGDPLYPAAQRAARRPLARGAAPACAADPGRRPCSWRCHVTPVPLLHDYLLESARRLPDKVALVVQRQRWTYRELDERSNALAHALAERGVVRGDRVIVFGDSSAETAIAFWAVLKANAVVAMVHPQTKADKLAYLLRDCRAKALVADAGLASAFVGPAAESGHLAATVVFGPAGSDLVRSLPGGVAWEEAIAKAPHAEPPPRRCIDVDLAALVYTSGSTGEPKGVMLTHRNMLTAATSITSYLENVEDDVILGALPLSFDYGLYQLIMAFKVGARLVLERGFAYPAQVLQRVVEEGVTGLPGVPTMFAVLAEMRSLSQYDFSKLRYVTNTAAALPVKHILRLKEIFPKAAIYSMYGLTECKRCTYLPPKDLDRKPTSVGIAIPNTELWVVDEKDRRLGPNQVGQLVIRGATVMAGYWEKPEQTAQKLRPGPLPGERVLYTGDYCRLDEEGYLYFVARMDDIIKSRGEKVAPKEVEAALVDVEGVREAAVIGVPDELLGQAVKAYVVLEQGAKLSERDLLRECQRRLEGFMVPKYVTLVDELPKTGSGKIKKTGLS
ncbi:MAG: asparagine synthase (glutamine-hydrolyzing) [Myxococcales bacterium]